MHRRPCGGPGLTGGLATAGSLVPLVLFALAACPAGADDAAAGGAESVNAEENLPDDDTRRMLHWNEYEGRWFTARLGGGFLYDTAGYSQDSDSESQFAFETKDYVRDSRLLLKGRLKFSPRLKYTIGYMYDPAPEKKTWFWRQTGIYIDMPEWGGDIFVGRTKEGISMNKMMVGYNGWTNERATANDSFLPILADGIQVRGSVADRGIAWNIGLYGDEYTESESFNKNDNTFVARGVWQPFRGKSEDILHFGIGYRYGTDEDGQMQYKSRPESFSAPFVLDTGKFDADHTQTVVAEAYYERGSLFMGGEYFVNKNAAPGSGDPFFHGGEVVVTWLTGGQRRPYNAKTGVFGGIVPQTSIFEGGRGTWEFVARLSYTDLDDGAIQGGKFWRFTPMVNWHMSPNVRLELVYGYGELDRFGVKGGSQFFQTRIQLQL
ncbi:MAG TPA: porin [Steroidobacteraceae bacterium]|nr:porin [Steroidobacteraceae bacterium]